MTFLVMRSVMRFFQETLHRSYSAQAAVAQSEKMAALGAMLANLGHEIKNPVTVIGSALWFSELWWRESFPKTQEVMSGLAPDQLAPFWLLLRQGRESGARTDADNRSERATRARLRKDLEQRGFAAASDWSEDLVTINLDQWDPRWDPLTRDDGGRAGLEYALRVLTLDRTNRNSHAAYESLQTLVMALGSFARSERPDESPIPCRVAEGLQTVLTLYGAAHKNEVEIIRNLKELPPVNARPEELIQVWTNLVQNALQAMGGRGTLTVTTERQDSWAVVTIADTGPGVPAELREKIFSPFFTTKERGVGTGLGLGIVQKLVSSCGGTVQVFDAPGGGAAFEVRLPLSDGEAPPT